MLESINGFDWDAGNREKCRKHGVALADIEALFRGPVAVHPARFYGEEERFILARAICISEKSSTMKKLPRLRTDKAAEDFVANADLTEYDLSDMRVVQFEFEPKTERVNMRLPRTLLDAVKARAAKQGIPYQRFIRQTLESAVARTKR